MGVLPFIRSGFGAENNDYIVDGKASSVADWTEEVIPIPQYAKSKFRDTYDEITTISKE